MAGFCREDILMEDNDILVVHKHAGMAVQNARMGQMDLEHALLNYLAKQARAETPGQARTQIPYLAVVHRLDQPVERRSQALVTAALRFNPLAAGAADRFVPRAEAAALV